MWGKRKHFSYTPPATDSARAKANAVWCLLNAAKFDHITPEKLAHDFRLRPATAAQLIEAERRRRNG